MSKDHLIQLMAYFNNCQFLELLSGEGHSSMMLLLRNLSPINGWGRVWED